MRYGIGIVLEDGEEITSADFSSLGHALLEASLPETWNGAELVRVYGIERDATVLHQFECRGEAVEQWSTEVRHGE